MRVCPPAYFTIFPSHTAHCYYVHHSVPPLELRGRQRRLYLRITIFDADERWGVVVSPGSSVTKEDLILSCKHWEHWNGIENVFSSFHFKMEREWGISINYSSACLGQINCGRNGRRRGGAEKRRRLRRKRRRRRRRD